MSESSGRSSLIQNHKGVVVNGLETTNAEWQAGFSAGRRHGLAIAALVISLISFVSLLGAEKAVTSIVLGVLAFRGATPGSLPSRLGKSAVVLGSLFMVTAATVLFVFWNDVVEFVHLLEKLS
jgi:hypothetical protein